MNKLLSILFKAIIALILTSLSFHGYGQANNFSYVVTGSGRSSSAGVYNSSGVLIRTIWSLKPETTGTKVGWWDGNDDFGNAATGSPYTIKVLTDSVVYAWDGVIGNSATVQTGYHTLGGMFGDATGGYGAVAYSTNIYFLSGYGEGNPSEWKTTAANIHYRTEFVGSVMDCALEFIATDGTNVYIAGYDSYSTTHTFVYAHTVPGEVPVTFSSGTNYKPVNGTTQSMIAYSTAGATPTYEITGLAAQQTHNYLIVTRAGINQVLVVNKTTGATAQTITTITAPSRCTVDGLDDVWIADASSVKQYSINSGTGALTATGNSIALANVGGLACSPNGTKIAAIDITNEQVKQYNLTGSLLNTLGTGVSYQTNPAVANNKFYWDDTTNASYLSAFVTYLADSSILVGDRANGRTQHFASDFSTFVESQVYTSRDYNVAVDNNNSQRLFVNTLEYAIDYTKSIGSCWTLVSNWGGKLYTANFNNQLQPVTLSNGHTYTFIRGPSFTFYCYELVAGYGLRYCGINKNFANGYAIDPATGNLIAVVSSGGTTTYQVYALTGFDGSNNPIWSGSHTGTPITVASTDPNQSNGINSNVLVTSLGNYIVFGQQPYDTSSGKSGAGYHLGSAAIGASTWRWESLIGTDRRTYLGPFPGEGQSPTNVGVFDQGNGVVGAGAVYGISGTNIFMGYHGEFWKSGQTNYYWHYDDSTGLPIGEFGKSAYDYPGYQTAAAITNFAPAQVTGNALNGTAIVGTDGVLYLYYAEESTHDGPQRWRITGLNTVSHQTATYPVAGPGAPGLPGTDLLSGFSRGQKNFSSGTGGWTRTSADFNNANGYLTSTTGAKSYDITKSPDISITEQSLVGGTDIGFTKQLISGGVRTSSWQLGFDPLWDNNLNNGHISPPYTGGSFIELLDSTGKIIANVQITGNNGAIEYITMNGVDVYSDSNLLSVYRTYVRFKPTNQEIPTVTWTYLNGSLTMTYQTVNGPYSTVVTTPFQSGGDLTQPYTLKLHFFENSSGGFSNLGKSIAIQNAFFNQTYVPPIVGCNCAPRVSPFITIIH